MKLIGLALVAFLGWLIWPHAQKLANQVIDEVGQTIWAEDRRKAINSRYYRKP